MIEKIGTNAGLVWNALNETVSAMNVKELKKISKLTDKDLYAALGWLARENKIEFSEVEKDLFIALR